MSYTYLQDAGEESSADSFADIRQSALWKSNHTPEKSYSSGSATESFRASQSGTMCEPSTAGRGTESLTLCAVASRAKTSAVPEKAQDSMENEADCGPKCEGSSARYHPNTSSWKTRQCSLFGGLVEFSENWPRWGMMRNGELWEHVTPVRHTNGKESGYLPTPKASDFKVDVNDSGEYARRTLAAGFQDALPFWIKRKWSGVRGVTNLDFVDWLMGWPIGWSALESLATDKFRLWCESYGIPCGVDPAYCAAMIHGMVRAVASHDRQDRDIVAAQTTEAVDAHP